MPTISPSRTSKAELLFGLLLLTGYGAGTGMAQMNGAPAGIRQVMVPAYGGDDPTSLNPGQAQATEMDDSVSAAGMTELSVLQYQANIAVANSAQEVTDALRFLTAHDMTARETGRLRIALDRACVQRSVQPCLGFKAKDSAASAAYLSGDLQIPEEKPPTTDDQAKNARQTVQDAQEVTSAISAMNQDKFQGETNAGKVSITFVKEAAENASRLEFLAKTARGISSPAPVN